MYDLTIMGKLMYNITFFLKLRKYNKQIEGIENLLESRKNYEKISLLASHAHSYDIPFLAETVHNCLKKENYPIFIMRKGLQFPITKKHLLSIEKSQWIYVNQCKSLEIDQTSKRGLRDISDQIKGVFEENKILVLYPGATRFYGDVNGITEGSTAMFVLEMKRKGLDKNHAIIPVGTKFVDDEKRSATLKFGEPLSIDGVDPREASKYVFDSLVKLTDFNLENLTDAKTVREYIVNENRESKYGSISDNI